jgi:hypothetical protein
MNRRLELAIVRLLNHSWKEIFFKYEYLTPQEKECINEGEHADLLAFVRQNMEHVPGIGTVPKTE